MTRGDQVIVMSSLLMKGTKLNQTVAHHVRVRGVASLYLVHRIFRHLIPILLMTINHLQLATIAMRHSSRHLQVLFRRAIPLLLFLWTNLDVEAIWMQSEACKLVHHDAAIYTTRQQHGYALIL